MSDSVIRYIHTWRHDQRELVLHTVPMLHIGARSYYQRINEIISDCNHVLVEGIPKLPTREIGTYRRLARAANLVSQIESLQIPGDVRSINIDIGQDFFCEMYKKLPLSEKLRLRIYDIVAMTVTPRITNRFRDLLVSYLRYPDDYKLKLIDPKNHYAFKYTRKLPFELLTENYRNDAIQANLAEYIRQNRKRPYRLDVGILFGDGHMPYIYEILIDEGFAWMLEEKIIVF